MFTTWKKFCIAYWLISPILNLVSVFLDNKVLDILVTFFLT